MNAMSPYAIYAPSDFLDAALAAQGGEALIPAVGSRNDCRPVTSCSCPPHGLCQPAVLWVDKVLHRTSRSRPASGLVPGESSFL